MEKGFEFAHESISFEFSLRNGWHGFFRSKALLAPEKGKIKNMRFLRDKKPLHKPNELQLYLKATDQGTE